MRISNGLQCSIKGTPRSESYSMQFRVAIGLLGFLCTTLPACSFEWDPYDPRLGSGGAGGDDHGGGPVDPTCGKPDLLSEDFENPVDLTWLWDDFADPAVMRMEESGQLLFLKVGQDLENGYGSLETTRTYDLRDSSISVEFALPPDPSSPGQMALSLFYDDKNDVGMHYQGNLIKYGATKDGIFSEKGSFPFDLFEGRFLRMRESAGALYWESSPDGTTWSTRAQTPTSSLIPEAVGFIRLDAYWPTNTPSGDEARFDNLKGQASGSPHWCSALALRDSFNDNTMSHLWVRSRAEDGCTFEETNGQLVVHPSVTKVARCGYLSGAAYDLTSASVAVEIAQMVNTAADVDMQLALECKSGTLQISQQMGTLSLGYSVQGTPSELASNAYDTKKHHWWRIREEGGTVYWEVSADGKTWTEVAKAANPFDVKACDVYLSAGTGDVVPMPGEARFDNLNRTP